MGPPLCTREEFRVKREEHPIERLRRRSSRYGEAGIRTTLAWAERSSAIEAKAQML